MIIDFRFLGQNGGSTSGGGMTSGDVQSLIESYNYVDSGEVETQITAKDYVNQNALIDEFYSAVGEDLLHAGSVQSVLETAGIIVANSEESDLTINVLPTATSDLTNDSGYITSADTQNFLTSADTQNFVGTADFEEATEVISTALNDLNERMSNIPSGSTNNAPIFIDSADTTNKANDIWDAIMNDGYIPDIWLTISIAGDLTHVKLNAFESSMVDGEIDLYFQWGNTMYKWSLLYDNQTGHAAFDSFNSNQFGVNTNGSILGVRKVAQTAYNELVASGETDETTAYYVVPDDPCSGMTQEECDCINSGYTWENGECNTGSSSSSSSSEDDPCAEYGSQEECDCVNNGGSWQEMEANTWDCDCGDSDPCNCWQAGGTWVDDGNGEGHCEGLEEEPEEPGEA